MNSASTVLALVELCDQLERSFDVSLPDEVFLTAATPRQWLEAIDRARGEESLRHDDVRPGDGAPTPPQSLSVRAVTLSRRIVAGLRSARESRAPRSSHAASTRLDVLCPLTRGPCSSVRHRDLVALGAPDDVGDAQTPRA